MNSQIDISYSFGEYLLDVSEKRLLKDSTVVHLTPKAFDTLVVLVSHKGRIVEKDALLDEVWTDTFVEEGTLAQNILTLRKALGTLEDGKQFIETVPRRGYRFIADVREIVRDDEILIFERRVKTEITAEHKTVSDEDAIAVRQPQTIDVSPQNFFRWLKQNRIRAAGAVVVCVLLFVTAVFSVRYALQPEKFSSSQFNKIEVSKLTSDGSVFRAAISPDGKYLALVEKRGENQLIRVKQPDASAAIEILPPKKQTILGLTFSPDGRQIYFVSYDDASPKGAPQMGHLYRVPMLGGTPQEMLEDIDSVPAISPDGRQIAFVRNYLEEKQSVLIISEIGSGNERKIAARNLKEAFSANGLSWSPDGKTVACTGYVTGEVGKQMDAFLVNAATGEQKSLTKENWLWIGQTAWLADGSGVIFPAWNSRSGSSADEIWLIPTDGGGDARQISSGINGVFSLSLTADSKSITAVKTDRLTDFWISSADDLKQATKILQNHAEYNMSPPGVDLQADERIVFGSTFNGNLDIWTMNPDGGNRQQLTTDKAADFFPAASGDGQTIIFVSNRSGRENLWRMKADGNRQEQVTREINVSSPSIAPDNRTVYYSSLEEKTGRYLLRKVNLETGESAQITSLPTLYPRLSPDGKYIACYFPEALNDGNFKESNLKLTILSAENGEVVKQFDAPFNQNRLSAIDWKGAQSISYLTSSQDDTKIWEQPVSGGEARVLLELPETSVFRFAWSQDGRRLIYEKGLVVTDAILINSKG
jgi:Tol biopolymer transport system component/DNA-binding winged helix-turn-helix (wHTH) protein